MIHHVHREANQCADFLARLGADQGEALVVSHGPPGEIREFLIRDSLNL